ncbi:MAG: hypothetical protein IJU37_01020 [Desulfovibrio sp.]|nr:hypothetical protein [Desulfovibrio sp.]
MVDFEDCCRMRWEKYFPATSIRPPRHMPDACEANGARVLLAHWLLKLETAQRTPAFVRTLPGVRLDDATAWTEVPLLLEVGNAGRIFPVLLGLLPCTEIRVEAGWLSLSAEDAARAALTLAGHGEKGFVLLPRASPPGARPIDGASLALPLAAAGRRLVQGRPLPWQIMMTGALAPDGTVLAVDAVSAKYDAFRRRCHMQDGRAFFYPLANNALDRPDACAVTSLDATLALCALCDAHGAGLLQNLASWRWTPQYFFTWLTDDTFAPDLLHPLLDLAEREHWHFSGGAALSEAVHRLYAWRARQGRLDHLERLLRLFPSADQALGLDNLALLRLASMHATLESHAGRVDGPWQGILAHCLQSMGNDNPETAAELLLAELRLANVAYNAYNFHMPISPAWLEHVQARRSYCARFSEDATLGKAYGFLTQRAAFVGQWKQALEYAQTSLRFFGATVCEKKRRWIDRVYIFCEMGRTAEAEHELRLALTASLDSAALAATDQLVRTYQGKDADYVHAAFVRICRQFPPLLGSYPVADILDGQCQDHHPWQCWSHNCGRLLAKDNPDLARRCLHRSLAICRCDARATTLLPMALLPLAGLIFLNMEPAADVLRHTEAVLQELHSLCDQGQLHAKHFRPVLEAATPLAALQIVEDAQSQLFPFNYR